MSLVSGLVVPIPRFPEASSLNLSLPLVPTSIPKFSFCQINPHSSPFIPTLNPSPAPVPVPVFVNLK